MASALNASSVFAVTPPPGHYTPLYMQQFSPSREGAKQKLHSRKHVIWKLHLRTRNPYSSFPTLERERQDGPSAALLESPQKIRPGIPILVSFALNVSFINICAKAGQFWGICSFPYFRIYHQMSTAWELLSSQYGGRRIPRANLLALAFC